MSSRSAFYDGVLPVDWWQVTAPPGSPQDGDIALIAPAGATGVFSAHPGELAFYTAATTSWRFQAASSSPGMRGILLFCKGAGVNISRYFGHDGTLPIGPFLTSSLATGDGSNNIASEEFGD